MARGSLLDDNETGLLGNTAGNHQDNAFDIENSKYIMVIDPNDILESLVENDNNLLDNSIGSLSTEEKKSDTEQSGRQGENRNSPRLNILSKLLQSGTGSTTEPFVFIQPKISLHNTSSCQESCSSTDTDSITGGGEGKSTFSFTINHDDLLSSLREAGGYSENLECQEESVRGLLEKNSCFLMPSPENPYLKPKKDKSGKSKFRSTSQLKEEQQVKDDSRLNKELSKPKLEQRLEVDYHSSKEVAENKEGRREDNFQHFDREAGMKDDIATQAMSIEEDMEEEPIMKPGNMKRNNTDESVGFLLMDPNQVFSSLHDSKEIDTTFMKIEKDTESAPEEPLGASNGLTSLAKGCSIVSRRQRNQSRRMVTQMSRLDESSVRDDDDDDASVASSASTKLRRNKSLSTLRAKRDSTLARPPRALIRKNYVANFSANPYLNKVENDDTSNNNEEMGQSQQDKAPQRRSVRRALSSSAHADIQHKRSAILRQRDAMRRGGKSQIMRSTTLDSTVDDKIKETTNANKEEEKRQEQNLDEMDDMSESSTRSEFSVQSAMAALEIMGSRNINQSMLQPMDHKPVQPKDHIPVFGDNDDDDKDEDEDHTEFYSEEHDNPELSLDQQQSQQQVQNCDEQDKQATSSPAPNNDSKGQDGQDHEQPKSCDDLNASTQPSQSRSERRRQSRRNPSSHGGGKAKPSRAQTVRGSSSGLPKLEKFERPSRSRSHRGSTGDLGLIAKAGKDLLSSGGLKSTKSGHCLLVNDGHGCHKPKQQESLNSVASMPVLSQRKSAARLESSRSRQNTSTRRRRSRSSDRRKVVEPNIECSKVNAEFKNNRIISNSSKRRSLLHGAADAGEHPKKSGNIRRTKSFSSDKERGSSSGRVSTSSSREGSVAIRKRQGTGGRALSRCVIDPAVRVEGK